MLDIKIKKMVLVEWQKLEWMQGDLKAITNKELKKLKESLIKNGFKSPFNVWEEKQGKRWILDGHYRQKALQELQVEGVKIPKKLPAVFIDCKNKKEAGEAVLIFASEYAHIEELGLKGFLNQYKLDFEGIKEKYNFSGIKDTHFINSHLRQKKGGEDEIPTLNRKKAKSRQGQTYLLGEAHRLYCGDATDTGAVSALFGEEKAQMVFTDPPYNLNYDFGENGMVQTGQRTARFGKIKNDNMDPEEFKEFIISAFENINNVLEEGGSYYISGGRESTQLFNAIITEAKKQWRWHIAQWLIWVKENFNISRLSYHPKHEVITYGWKLGKPHKWYNDRSQVDVLEYKRHIGSSVHPTQKPVDLLGYLITNSTEKNEIVYDPFLGSGTTLIACEHADRVCYGMELDPQYCDVIIERYKNYTGKEVIKL